MTKRLIYSELQDAIKLLVELATITTTTNPICGCLLRVCMFGVSSDPIAPTADPTKISRTPKSQPPLKPHLSDKGNISIAGRHPLSGSEGLERGGTLRTNAAAPRFLSVELLHTWHVDYVGS